MNTVCTCKPEDQDDDFDSAKGDVDAATVRINEIIDFGKVATGKKVYKVFEIENTSSIQQEYSIHFDPKINPIYRPFDFYWNRIVDVGQSLQCKISYTPIFASSVNVDYLYIHETSGTCCTLSLRGESVGPRVEISTTYVTFYATNGKRSEEHIIELSNNGSSDAIYQFDITNSKTGLYSLSRNRGIIPVNKQHFIKIAFAPLEQGVYCEALPLLILDHKPRIIYLVGICVRNVAVTDLLIKHYGFNLMEKDDFSGYLYDVMTVAKHPPPFSLSAIYLNFEGIDSGSNEMYKTLITSLTNHMSEEIEVEWYEDNSSCFTITPKLVKIPAFDSSSFECKFTPTVPDQFYHQVLSGSVYWIDPRKIDNTESYANVPIPSHIRLYGHSFPCNKRWIPQLTMPEIITLPPCLPNSSSVTTFMFKLNGYLPVSYRFIAPNNSKFIIKPMMGVVNDYQIAVVFLQCGTENKKAYIERWNIELNGLPQMRSIFIKGYCENPYIKIGINNAIKFPTVHPQCQEFETVQVCNNSVHCLRYKFHLSKNHNLLQVDYPEGMLTSNEVINLKWTITGQLHSPSVYTIICELRTLNNMEMTGTQFEIPLKIYTECEYSELCSMPRNIDLEKLEVGTNHTFKFNLFNFGTSSIHYKLIFWDNKRINFDDKCLTVIPSQGTLKPKENNEILLCLHCDLFGKFNVQIYYQTLMSKDSSLVINSNEIRKIFEFKFSSTYPTIQIVDIDHHNFGPLFSKAALWDIFNINKINHHLRSMKNKETKNVNIFLPESEFTEEIFKTAWLLKNNTCFDTLLIIKRNKVCDCPLQGKSKSLTFRTKAFECKHRDLFSFNLSGELLQANAYQTLEITVQYHEVGLIHMSYSFNLSHSRILMCNIFINTLPGNINCPSKYLSNFHVKLGTVCVEDEQPPARAFWLYNNSSKTVSYNLNVDSANKSIYVKDYEILHCFNPQGSLLPYTAVPILFKFHPLQCKSYHFIFPITLGENSYQFNLKGHGSIKSKDKKYDTSSLIQANVNQLDKIYFSNEHIYIRPLPVWSKAEVIFFIKNMSQDIIGYSFQRAIIEGIVEIKAVNRKGVLKPKESHMVIIQVFSFDQSCEFRMHFTCKLLNHTQYYKYRRTSVLHHLKQQELKEQFIITEEGIKYPENEIQIEPLPLNFFKTISFDIKIISVNDIDKFMNCDNQFSQLPQFMLNLDSSKISEALITKQSEQPIRTSFTDKNLAMEKNVTSNLCKVLDVDNVELVRDAIDCIIMNVLKTSIFHKIIEERQDLTPYYIQIKTGGSQQQEIEHRKQMLEDSLKIMQAPLIAEIFQQLITESIHEVFQLGSQMRSKIDIDYVYNKICKCNQCTESCAK